MSSLYAMSYMYLGTFAFIGCMIPAIIISIATGGNDYRPGTIRNIFGFLPPRFQKWFTCGVFPENEKNSKVENGINMTS